MSSFFVGCFLAEYLYKKPLRAIVVFKSELGAKKAVLMLRGVSCPLSGQAPYIVGCTLRDPSEGSVSKTRRLSWMEGSDSDDEDQHSWSTIQEEIQSQPKPVVTVFVL